MKVHLETARLVIREFGEADFEDLCALNADSDVMRFITDGRPRSPEETRQFLDSCLSAYLRLPGFGTWAALEKPNLEFAGWFHFRPDYQLPESMEVGYRLMKHAWGRGLATEGSMGLIDAGGSAGVRTVTGRTLRANAASARVLQKAGLTLAGEYEEQRFPGVQKAALLFQRTLA